MKVVSGDVAEWSDEWQALHLFSAFAFRKARDTLASDRTGELELAPERAAESEGVPYDIGDVLRL